jgi:septum site-determining protein MinD
MKNLDLSLCMADFSIADYTDVVDGRLGLMEACHEHPVLPGLFFLSAPTVFVSEESDYETAQPMFDEIRREFDFCFLDSPSGIRDGFSLANASADMSIIVTNGDLPAMRDAQRAADTARELGACDLRLLVNRILPGHFKRVCTTVDYMINLIGAQLLGVIREDNSVFLSLHQNTPLILYSRRLAAYDFLDAARRITGEDIPLRFKR